MTRTIASLWRAPLAAALLVGSAAIAAPASADTPMMVGLDGVYVTEADSGTTPMVFTATLSAVPTSTVSLRFQTFVLHSRPQPSDATPGGSCTQGVDYIAVDQVVSIPANADPPQATVSVPVCGDTVSEGNEVINARLTNLPANVSCREICLGWATIYDNDSFPAASVGNASSVEGDGGRFSLIQHVNFPVTLDGPSASTITVQYATAPTQAVTKEQFLQRAVGSTACGRNVDYISTSGTLTFNPGETSKTVSVAICGDTTSELTESLLLQLSSPSAAGRLGDAVGVGTIVNND